MRFNWQPQVQMVLSGSWCPVRHGLCQPQSDLSCHHFM